MRTATARREHVVMPRPADILIAPDVPGVELRDWKKYESAVADGYKTAKEAIEQHWPDLAPIIVAANDTSR